MRASKKELRVMICRSVSNGGLIVLQNNFGFEFKIGMFLVTSKNVKYFGIEMAERFRVR